MATVTVQYESGAVREFTDCITRTTDRENFILILSFVTTRSGASESRPIAIIPREAIETLEIDWSAP